MFAKKRAPATPPEQLLPWYLNHTLDAAERQQVEQWLAQQPEAAHQLLVWQQVRAAASSQPQAKPPLTLRRQIMARANATRRMSSLPHWMPWFSGVALALVVLIALWSILQPGIGLQWSVSGEQPTGFLIYRAPLNSSQFEVVREIPAQPGHASYTFVDMALSPGQAYQYRVETPTREAVSATIAVSSAEVLPLQIIILLSSFACGLAAVYVLRQFDAAPSRRRPAI